MNREWNSARFGWCKRSFTHSAHILALFIHSSRMESSALLSACLVFRRQSGTSGYSLVWTLPKRASVDVSHRVDGSTVCSVYIDWHYEADQSTLPVCLEGSKEVVCEERDLRLDAPPPPTPPPFTLFFSHSLSLSLFAAAETLCHLLRRHPRSLLRSDRRMLRSTKS